MEYSELFTALREGDELQVSKIFRELIPRLVRFLRIRMGASKADAQDCVQESLELVLEVIRDDKLDDPEKLLNYLMTTCRNIYLKVQEKKREVNYKHVPSHQFHEPSQYRSLIDKEQKKILARCLDELKEVYRSFIDYLFSYPDSHAEKIAAHFNISVNNVWTRKHRVLKQLNECYQKKSQK